MTKQFWNGFLDGLALGPLWRFMAKGDLISAVANERLACAAVCRENANRIEAEARRIAEEEPDDGCICRGNWRNIVSECENLFQKKFSDRDGQEWTFFGLVWGEDDFYYGMWRDDGKVSLLSCVGSIEVHGFTPVRPNVRVQGRDACGASAGTTG